ncbi:hypothetical protein GC173_13660 [bacterium]|nr:hypothetical protein [bacterium]
MLNGLRERATARSRKIILRHGLAVGCLFLFSLAIYGPTLWLPFSLIDDGRLGEMAAGVVEKGTTSGLLAGFRETIKPEENFLGPAMRWLVTLQYLLFGGEAWLWHAAKILQHVSLAIGIYCLALQTGARRVAAVGASLFCTLMDAPSAQAGFQSYAINYARLFTTDSVFIPFAVWGMVFFLRALRAADWRGTVWPGLGLIVCFGLAGLTKLNFIPLAIAMMLGGILWTITAALLRQRVIVGLCVLGQTVIAILPGLLFFQPWKKQSVTGYESTKIATSLSSWLTNATPYAEGMVEVASLLLPIAIVAVLILLGWGAWVLFRDRQGNRAIFGLSIICLCFGGAFAFQALWPIVIARYSITFAPFFAILFVRGIEATAMACAVFLASAPKIRAAAILAVGTVLGALVWSLLFRPYYELTLPSPGRQRAFLIPIAVAVTVVTVAALCSLAPLKFRFRDWLRAPALFLVLGHLLWMTPLLVRHTHEVIRGYMTREQQIGVLLEEVRRVSPTVPEGQTATIYVNLPNGEEFWSIPLVARHYFGIKNIKPGRIQPGKPFNPTPYDRVVSLVSTRQRTESNLPPILEGAVLDNLPIPTGNAPALVLEPGKPQSFKLALSRASTVVMLGVEGDPLAWDPRLDLVISISTAEKPDLAMVTFRTEDVPRGRTGQPVIVLPEPINLPGGVELDCRFEAKASQTVGVSDVSTGRIILTRGSSIAGQSIPPTPRLRLVAFDPASPRMEVIVDEHFTTTHHVTLSPAGLLIGYARKTLWHQARIPLADRLYRYNDHIQIARVPGPTKN